MKHEIHTCDICGRKFTGYAAVRNDIAIFNGEHSGVWKAVCDNCTTRVYNFIMSLVKEPTGLPKDEKETIPEVRPEVLVGSK